ncbi:MAG TPA: condensation domain-containing protein [Acidobacteriaceae bacterium]|nr:condensation domain-containing protein [Acidobacteriaceae bacterium]
MGLDLLTTAETISGDTEQAQVCVFPASLEQSRYWILQQLEPASTASNMAIAFRLEGLVDDAIVERCIRELTLRHEALRTVFRIIDGELSQVIGDEPRFSFRISDLRSLAADEARDRAEALIHEHSEVRIDLAAGPVFFVHLIHLTEQDHFLAFTIHHIACDGWSNGVLVRDFAEMYAGFREDRPAALPPLPFQFADFTVWQQQWQDSEEAAAALAFWREHIRRDMPAVDLPTDRPRSASKSGPGQIESLLLSPELNAKLRAYCRQNDATMHQVLLAAFEGVLSRYADQTEFLLGSTIANRTQAGMEHVVGRFAHPQVILADVQGDPSFRDLVRRVAEWSAKSYAHQDLPFSRLMEAFQLDQSGAGSQFLQVYFVYQKAFMQPQQAGALRIVPRPSVSGGVNFDLLVSVVERTEGPRLQMEYNTALFDGSRIRRLIEMYARVLEAAMDADMLRVSEFPLLAPEEKASHAIPAASSMPVRSGSHTLLSWLEEHAAADGEGTAIVSGRQPVSWLALRRRSRELAAAIRKLGVEAGQVVALHLEQTVETTAAAWALLKIGAIVLPIPQGISEAEWKLIVLELRPALSLSHAAIAEKLSELTSFEKLRKTEPAGAAAASHVSPSPSQTAWLNIRTDPSGHYGITAVSHQATLQSILGAACALDLRPRDPVLVWPGQASSCESWTDLLLPLLAGAVTVHSNGVSAPHLQALLDEEQVAFVFAAPSEFAEWTAGGWQGDRRVHLVCRGAGTSAANLQRLAHFPGKTDVLHSSPFTAGPFAISHFRVSCDPHSAGFDGRLLPLGGQQLMVIERSGSPAPYGVTGELAVRSANPDGTVVRTGYLARACPEGGWKLGDLASRTVRHHGYRLRLGDLESLLLRNPEIATAEAALLRGPGNRPLLTAYVSGRAGQKPDLQAAAARLKKQAPAHLSVAELIAVETIPRQIDGSANFSALPRPGAAHPLRSAASGEAVAPRDELETKLVRIWEEVLGVQGIGIRNSFFSLGGYSLMIVRLFARMNKALGTSLPITTIFNAPTVEQLAALLRGNVAYSWLVPVQPRGTQPPFFLIHSYLIYDGLRSALGEDRPFYGLRELDRDDEMTVERRAGAYVQEIRSVQPGGPYYLGGWCAAGPLAVETARQLAEAGESVAMVVLFDSWRPGYAAELAQAQAGDPLMRRRAVLSRKYRFHRMNLKRLSAPEQAKYFWTIFKAKLRSSRDRIFVRHWGAAQRVCTRFGFPLPPFMHNVSRKTLDSAKDYKGQPYSGSITLIRATDAPYFPQAEPACGWNSVAQGGVEVLFAPGTHESMFLEPNLSALGEILESCFQKAAAKSAEPGPSLTLPGKG